MSIIVSIVVSLVIAAVSIALSELLKPKPDLEDAKPAGLGDFKFPTAIEGRPIPVVWGTVQITGPNVIWWGDFTAKAIRKTIKTGLWSKKRLTTGYKYFAGIQMGLCLGQVDEVSKIWIGDTLVADGSVQDGTYPISDPSLFGGNEFGNGGMDGTIRVASGSEVQTNSAYLTAQQTEAVPHLGVCHVTYEGGYVGNSTTIKPWKFEVKRYPNQLALTAGREIVNSADANPAAVLYELLTDDDWGFGLSTSLINASVFRTAGNTLYTEGNGWSMVLDRVVSTDQLLKLLQEQIDGVVYFDQTSGQFQLSLARDDYVIGSVKQLTEDDIITVKEFTRGTWEETSNQVRIGFTDRDRDYFDTFAPAADLGNQRIQGGELIAATIDMPGCKTKSLATNIASRELRQRAVPLAKATIVVNRDYWDVVPNEVIAWTDDNMGFTQLPMRVVKIDGGRLEKGEITLSLIQDVYKFSAAFFGEPDSTLWVPPTGDITAAPANELVAVESPYAIAVRGEDPQLLDRVWCGMRKQDNEITYKIHQRNAVGTPSGDYTEDSDEIPDFFFVGELRSTLTVEDQDGTADIDIDPLSGGDTVAEMVAQITASASAADRGQNLVNIIMIGEDPTTAEFIAPQSATDNTTYLTLNNCYRGLLDTLPGAHAAGTKVYMIFMGGDLALSAITQGNNVDVQLRGISFTDETTEGEANTKQLTMAHRRLKPYPPSQVEFNNTVWGSSIDLDDDVNGTGLDAQGLLVEWVRRDLQTFDEVAGLTTDAASIDSTFPAKHTTEYQTIVNWDISSLETDLEAFWKLEEASGATRLDETANSYDLSDTGTVVQQAGKLGNAASFDTGNRYLQVASTGTFNFGANADFMIAGWIYLDDKASSYTFWSKDESTADRGWHVRYSSGPDRFTFAYSDDGSTLNTEHADILGSPSASTWYFIVAYHDGVNDEVGISVNGGAFDTASHSLGINQSLQEFTVGGHWSSTTLINRAKGDTDAVGIWSRILTTAELSTLYNGGNGREAAFTTTEVLNTGWTSDASAFLSAAALFDATGGAVPSSLNVTLETRHDLDGTVRESNQSVDHDVTVAASDFDDDTWLGSLSQNVTSASYTAPDTGTYNFEIGTAFATGAVEARINAGAWASVIAATNTSGTLAGVTAADTIEVRHTEASAAQTLLKIVPPTSTTGAFAVFE